MVGDQKVEQGSIENGRSVELLPSNGGADDGENTRADNRANSKSGERDRPQRFLQFSVRLLRVGDQLVDGLATEKLILRGSRTALRGLVSRRDLSQRALSPEERHLAFSNWHLAANVPGQAPIAKC